MILEDFVMLGKTIPEPQSDGRTFVCSAGVSQEYKSLIRIYPLAVRECPKRWQRCRVLLERNPKDNRLESFKLKGNRQAGHHEVINGECFEVLGELSKEQRLECLERFFVDSIHQANYLRKSLAIVQPKHIPQLDFDHNVDSPASPQMKLFDESLPEPEGAKRFPFIPRIEFEDDDGRHRLMLRDWGCFEFMRKQGDDRRYELHSALGLHNNPPLLVGNMNNQRTAWLVISVLSGLGIPNGDLFK